MKKFMFAALVVCVITSCNSNSKTGQGTADTTGTNVSGVTNVNGNMPDTTNAITIGSDNKDTLTTTTKDSTNQRHK